MSAFTITSGSQTINQSGSDSVAFLGTGTLNVTGTAASPITVTLAQTASVAALATMNLTYAHVILSGLVNASLSAVYNIGEGSTLEFQNIVGLGINTQIKFTGATGTFLIGTTYTPTVSTSFSGFGAGKTIQLASNTITGVSYTDNAGANTGGTLNLYTGNQTTTPFQTLPFTDGDFTSGNFELTAGSSGKTILYDATLSNIFATPGTATIGPNGVVNITIVMSSAVAITGGVPSLLLNDGGSAIYNAAASTPTSLVFTYTAASGQNTSDLAITGTSLNGATAVTIGGGAVNTLGVIGALAGTLVVDTLAPFVTAVSALPGSGTLGAGQTLTLDIPLSEPVSVTGGTPTLSLNDGGIATYDAAHSTANMLVFQETIQPGENAAQLAITGANLNGASINDLAGNALNLNSTIGFLVGQISVVTTAATTTTTTGGTTTPVTTAPTTVDSLPVYRFFEADNGTHFYTTSAAERDTILQTRPDLTAEGVGMRAIASPSTDPAATEVYRFFDTVHGTEFLTADTAERDNLISNRHDLTFEPNGSFFEHTIPQAGDTAVYRFFSSTDGTHFYTDNATERATILQTRPDLIAEGIGFYEPK